MIATTDDPISHWTRLNYGATAIKTKTVCVVDDYWKHTFSIPLPTPPRISSSKNAVPPSCDEICTRLLEVSNATRLLLSSMQFSIANMVGRIYDLIPDITAPGSNRRRHPRGVFNFVGSASSFLFGTVTESELAELSKHIADVKSLTDNVAAESARIKNSLIAFTQLSNDRFNTLHAVLNEQQKSLHSVASDIKSLNDRSNIELNAITVIALELARYVDIHDSIQELELGIEDLVQGRLTPKLISVDDINNALRNASSALRQQSMTLCTLTAKDVYASNTFVYARSDDDLFVRIRLPYTRYPPMTVFKTFVFPIPVPGSQGLVTLLKNLPRWLVRSKDVIGELSDPPALPIVDSSSIIFHERHQSSCLFAIISDDTAAVQAYCDFTTRRASIEPLYIRLNTTSYVVSNLSLPRTTCRSRRSRPLSFAPCAPCLVSLPCGCSLTSGEIQLAGPPVCTNLTTSTSVLHAVNLIVLQHFYDLDNGNLSGSTLLPPANLPPLLPLRLPLFSENATRLLAADESLDYSLRKLANSLANDSVVLHSPSEAILYDYIRTVATSQHRFPNFSEISTWLTLLPDPCIIFLCISHFSPASPFSGVAITDNGISRYASRF